MRLAYRWRARPGAGENPAAGGRVRRAARRRLEQGLVYGQGHITARTKYRGLVKRRLVPVELNTPGAAPGTPVMADGHEAGEIRSTAGKLALAMLRLDAVEKVLTASGAQLIPRILAWMQLPHPTTSSGTA